MATQDLKKSDYLGRKFSKIIFQMYLGWLIYLATMDICTSRRGSVRI